MSEFSGVGSVLHSHRHFFTQHRSENLSCQFVAIDIFVSLSTNKKAAVGGVSSSDVEEETREIPKENGRLDKEAGEIKIDSVLQEQSSVVGYVPEVDEKSSAIPEKRSNEQNGGSVRPDIPLESL